MSDALKVQYLQYALHCIDAAKRAHGPEDRMRFLEMAETWRSLAAQSDEVDAEDTMLTPPKSKMK